MENNGQADNVIFLEIETCDRSFGGNESL